MIDPDGSDAACGGLIDAFEPVSRAQLPEKVAADCRGCAGGQGYAEVAMLRRLTKGPERPVLRQRGRRLRVVSA